MFGLTTADYQKRKLRRRKQRVTRKRIALAFLLLAAFGRVADASSPDAIVFEDCSIAPSANATQAQRDALAQFNAIPDAQRMDICMLIDPHFLERFD